MSSALVEHCVELLAPLGAVRVGRMFGGHGYYVDGLFIALIAFERLYLKTDTESRTAFEAAGSEPFAYEARGRPVTVTSYWSAPAEAMESPALMLPWARLAMAAALRARQVRPPTRARATRIKPAATRASKPAPKSRGRAG